MLHCKIDGPATRIALVSFIMLISAAAHASLTGLVLVATLMEEHKYASSMTILAIIVIIYSQIIVFLLEGRMQTRMAILRLTMLAALQALMLFAFTGTLVISVNAIMSTDPLFLGRYFSISLFFRYFALAITPIGLCHVTWRIVMMRLSSP